ncbi:CPBP family intramembrane glutamic endopeptidase [Lactobacillus xujianguonis]|uniref:CPBP family intramembrane glutamic endopeptidase n=1 Tax=Lactobacillus xujianguonis TaxID=2495899 RepID=UPI000FD8F040|nr:CPBP family intramembrane glutamic endopeptidase [Lactobacillus xujianguonis]RVU73473.1 CPBP family intramembrane metalloprotease [Lactobacillus xujianguonis]
MNTPESREGNLIRYSVYVVGYLMAIGVIKLVTQKALLHIWDLVLFFLVAAMVLLFYIYRFNREQRFFARDYYIPWLSDFGLIIGLTLAVVATRIGVMYLQSYNRISWYSFQISYLKHESSSMFWFLILAVGVVLPILQEFLATGFLFNYAFRENSQIAGILGIVSSGLIFTILGFQPSLPLLVIDFLYGCLFAWSYLYTQTMWLPIYLAVVSALLTVIMT